MAAWIDRAMRQRMKVDGKGAKRNRSVCLTAKSWSLEALCFFYTVFAHAKEEEVVFIKSLLQEIVLRCFRFF
jgi:hypothetical protein